MIRQGKRVKTVSVIQSRRNRLFSAQCKVWKARPENQRCDYPGCGFHGLPDCHHKRGRLGLLLFDERFWIPLCRQHHDWVRDNPEAARSNGLLAERGDWNRIEKECHNNAI